MRNRFIPALALVFSACSVFGGTSGEEPMPAGHAELRIDNRHWLDLNVFLLQGGQSRRLGTVTATSRATFRIAAHALGDGNVRFHAAAIGSDAELTTNVVNVRPGGGVEWTLEARLAASSLRVF